MGLYEDDRIRSKNRLHDLCYTEVQNLRQQGLSDTDIVAMCNIKISSGEDRNDIFSTMLNIVGGSRGETT